MATRTGVGGAAITGSRTRGWRIGRCSKPANTYIRRYWNGSLELIAVMLDRHDFTQDETFARDTLVPLADALISFLEYEYDQEMKIGEVIASVVKQGHSAVNGKAEA